MDFLNHQATCFLPNHYSQWDFSRVTSQPHSIISYIRLMQIRNPHNPCESGHWCRSQPRFSSHNSFPYRWHQFSLTELSGENELRSRCCGSWWPEILFWAFIKCCFHLMAVQGPTLNNLVSIKLLVDSWPYIKTTLGISAYPWVVISTTWGAMEMNLLFNYS